MIYQLSFVLFIIGHLTQANAATRYKFSGDSEQSYGSQFVSNFVVLSSNFTSIRVKFLINGYSFSC